MLHASLPSALASMTIVNKGNWGKEGKRPTFDLLKDLQHLSSRTKSINASFFQSLLIQLHQLRPVHILKIVGIFVQPQTSQPAWDVLKKTGIGGILRRFRATSPTTWGSTSRHLTMIRQITFMSTNAELAQIEATHAAVHVVHKRGGAIICSQESVVLRRSEAHLTETTTLHSQTWGARAGSSSTKTGVLLVLHGENLLSTQNLAVLIDHDNISSGHVWWQTRRKRSLSAIV